ncbi:MAG TPA: COX aromatic rich motif-containing protein [Patescibacteria group bacterium]|nr:COX aromatic rich motif-containing protein [Patescibacteria group bacterium]
MPKNRKRSSPGGIAGRILTALTGLALIVTLLLRGKNIALFNSKGTIAHEQRDLIILTMGILFAIAIPTLILFFFTAWKYRESNSGASRASSNRHSKLLVPGIWFIPCAVAIVLAMIMWPAAHRLDPKKMIAADSKPLTIQVVSMRWKWVFIYPEQHIATVNFVQIPIHTPVHFELTADEAPMSSFWIPNLGGQLYSMTGHMNQLNLMGDTPGDYTGSSAEINGTGFSGMKFTTRVGSKDAFDVWVRGVNLSGHALDAAEYDRLLKPSQNNADTFYWLAENDLYDKVLMKYMGHDDDMHMMNMGRPE